jgi:hypothetical protein
MYCHVFPWPRGAKTLLREDMDYCTQGPTAITATKKS